MASRLSVLVVGVTSNFFVTSLLGPLRRKGIRVFGLLRKETNAETVPHLMRLGVSLVGKEQVLRNRMFFDQLIWLGTEYDNAFIRQLKTNGQFSSSVSIASGAILPFFKRNEDGSPCYDVTSGLSKLAFLNHIEITENLDKRKYVDAKLSAVLQLSDIMSFFVAGFYLNFDELPYWVSPGLHGKTTKELYSDNPTTSPEFWNKPGMQCTPENEFGNVMADLVEKPFNPPVVARALTDFPLSRSLLRDVYAKGTKDTQNKEDVKISFRSRNAFDPWGHLPQLLPIDSLFEIQKILQRAHDKNRVVTISGAPVGNIETFTAALDQTSSLAKFASKSELFSGNDVLDPSEMIHYVDQKKKFSAFIIVLDQTHGAYLKPEVKSFLKANLGENVLDQYLDSRGMVTNLNDLSNIQKMLSRYPEIENNKFKELLIDGFDVDYNFEQQVNIIVEHIRAWASFSPSPLSVVVGRGQTTGTAHCEKLSNSLQKRGYKKGEDFNMFFGYAPRDILNMNNLLGKKVLMISMVLSFDPNMKSGSIYVPTQVTGILSKSKTSDDSYFVRRCNVPFPNEAVEICPHLPTTKLIQLDGIINFTPKTKVFEDY